MIKEKKKNSKYNYKKTKKQILKAYIRTILFSVLFAAILTSGLAIQSRNEMLRDYYSNAQKQNLIDKATALRIISQSNMFENLKYKTYAVCMHAGKIYEIAEQYEKAQSAYELAIEKSNSKIFKPYNKLVYVLTTQEKFDKVFALLENMEDSHNKNLIKFKTRSYTTIGDKYYSIGKFLSAAKNYEKALFYYNKFSKKDKTIVNSLKNRIINSYIKVADIMVKSGYNTEAVRFLKKAEEYDNEHFQVRYKLAIVLSASNPEKSIEYFEDLINKIPQEIDYGIFTNALMKAANIADLDNRPTKAKYYRYKIHSIDLFIDRKVVYKNDIEIGVEQFNTKKHFFMYPINGTFNFLNVSNNDIINLTGDFVIKHNNKEIERITKQISNKKQPLLCTAYLPNKVNVNFNKKTFTKKELENYIIQIYLYKDEKFKTLAAEIKISDLVK